MIRAFLIAVAALLFTSAAEARAADYFEPSSRADVYTLLISAGYTIDQSQENWTWLVAPDGTRFHVVFFSQPGGAITGMRLNAWYFLSQSEAAIGAALYYEQTNPQASVSMMQSEDGEFVLAAVRDIGFSPGRTPENILRIIDMHRQLVLLIQDSLGDADPELKALWDERRAQSGP